ncbi:MAG TPA: RNA polymerase sigma factor [Streptosporangiaceae bacterium]|nr:RNA polymerase sigma factor [Streptosporangiaceae bacterium]
MRHQRSGEPADRRRRFEAIYATNCVPILGYALRRTANGDDAADVVAETFLTAWRRLDDVPPGGEARLWLYGVARNVLANHRRGERRRSELADRLRLDLAAAGRDRGYPDPAAADGTDLAAVAAAFRCLPEADRELLALVGWEGLDHGQIAAVLGCSRNAVRIRLHRARSRFAAAMADQPGPRRPGQRRSALAQLTNGDTP